VKKFVYGFKGYGMVVFGLERFKGYGMMIRQVGELIDTDWEENGSEGSEERTESGEDLGEEAIGLRRERRRMKREGMWSEWAKETESEESEDLGMETEVSEWGSEMRVEE
jgi:hypothetical protein